MPIDPSCQLHGSDGALSDDEPIVHHDCELGRPAVMTLLDMVYRSASAMHVVAPRAPLLTTQCV